MKFGTKVIHANISPDPLTGAVMTPIYQTSTYAQESLGKHKGYEYARTQNPTRSVLESNLSALENGTYGYTFASGLAAIDAVIKLLDAGDEVICGHDLYGGTYRIFRQVFEKFGLKFHFVNMAESHNIEHYINKKTKMIWLETPSNPLLSIVDLHAISCIAKTHDLLTVVDNTFATPYLQLPLDLGIDIVVHSVTKYISGHSDVIMGAVITKDESIGQKLAFMQNACGAVPSPNDCFLVLRGIKTLRIRMKTHTENAKKIAQFLEDHPKIQKVYYPGLTSHEGYEIAQKQMRDFGGMLSFTLSDNDIQKCIMLMQKLRFFTLAESLGGVESLCGHPATMTHAAIPKEEREKNGLKDSLIRLSVGIEDHEDLVNDLGQALDQI